jgi:serine/threonine protein kinase
LILKELIGKNLSGRYQLLEMIGDTGISTVFKALDLPRNLNVAVKILKQQAINNRFENIQRFRREAQILSSLRHPNLVRIYEAGEFSSMHYLVMELLKGQGMDAYIAKRENIDIDEILDFSIGVLDALAYVHNVGIIHRDLKPANIFISGMNIAINSDNSVQQPTQHNKDRVKILDFGLSQLVESIKTGVQHSVQGTFAYISPEQTGILQRPVDERSDLYAFGVILYELVTGVLPFEASGLGDLLTMRITKTTRQPRLLNISVPEELEKVILKLLSVDPDDRYQTSRGLVEDLVRIRNKETLLVLGRGDVPKSISFHTGMVGRDTEFSSLRNL